MRRLVIASVLLCLGTGCGAAVRRFPLRDVVWRDTDLDPVHVACHVDEEEPDEQLCRPREYVSSFTWDGADNIVFLPMTRFFAVDPAGQAANVNAYDEVADSAWWTNRIGRSPMTPEQVANGYCGTIMLDPNAADGSWVIDMGKPNGANPGFRVNVPGLGKFMLKADPPDQPERATGATSIASRLYYAMGYWAPCDTVVYFRPSILSLTPGLEFTDNSGVTRPFDQEKLDSVLEGASHRGELVRMVASRWLPGRAIGPFRYIGTRDDDPNDVIPHDDRRELRGGRVIAAWLNHFDSREQNSMDTWMSVDPENKDSSPGHVRHWYIDLGDCFGSEWEWEGISRRLGHAYYFDGGYIFADFLTLGLIERPWERAERRPPFGYYHARDFDPDDWRGGYPNPTFNRMTEGDAAWATRILARLTPAHIEAAIAVGDYSNQEDVAFLTEQVVQRHRVILERYLSELSPITDLEVDGPNLCGLDLARSVEIARSGSIRYSANAYWGETFGQTRALEVEAQPNGKLCVPLPSVAQNQDAPPDAASRYLIVDLHNGISEGPTRAHFYDLGPQRGHVLVGIERPSSTGAPR